MARASPSRRHLSRVIAEMVSADLVDLKQGGSVVRMPLPAKSPVCSFGPRRLCGRANPGGVPSVRPTADLCRHAAHGGACSVLPDLRMSGLNGGPPV